MFMGSLESMDPFLPLFTKTEPRSSIFEVSMYLIDRIACPFEEGYFLGIAIS